MVAWGGSVSLESVCRHLFIPQVKTTSPGGSVCVARGHWSRYRGQRSGWIEMSLSKACEREPERERKRQKKRERGERGEREKERNHLAERLSWDTMFIFNANDFASCWLPRTSCFHPYQKTIQAVLFLDQFSILKYLLTLTKYLDAWVILLLSVFIFSH